MTIEGLKKNWLVVVAFHDGKTIQVKHNSVSGDAWEDCSRPTLSPDYSYRIKPEPKLRAWTGSEVPIGAIVCSKNPKEHGNFRYLITGYSTGNVFVGAFGSSSACSLQSCFQDYNHSIDGGKTWHPCGIVE